MTTVTLRNYRSIEDIYGIIETACCEEKGKIEGKYSLARVIGFQNPNQQAVITVRNLNTMGSPAEINIYQITIDMYEHNPLTDTQLPVPVDNPRTKALEARIVTALKKNDTSN